MKSKTKRMQFIYGMLISVFIAIAVLSIKAHINGYRFGDTFTFDVQEVKTITLSTVHENEQSKHIDKIFSENDRRILNDILCKKTYVNNFFGNIDAIVYQLSLNEGEMILNLNEKGEISLFRISEKSKDYAFFTAKFNSEEYDTIIDIISLYNE